MRDFHAMVNDIDCLFNTDQAASLIDHDSILHPEVPIPQEDAIAMRDLLGKIYMIAHGITCSCGDKYEI